jgi:predicted RNA methylase
MTISIDIPREDFRDKIVLNVNSGIGILSMMASTAGAAKVYMII